MRSRLLANELIELALHVPIGIDIEVGPIDCEALEMARGGGRGEGVVEEGK